MIFNTGLTLICTCKFTSAFNKWGKGYCQCKFIIPAPCGVEVRTPKTDLKLLKKNSEHIRFKSRQYRFSQHDVSLLLYINFQKHISGNIYDALKS